MSARRILVSALALVSLSVPGGVMCLAGSAVAAGCPNEEFRTGPSASLPDCRAYELVTPEELGRTQAMTFTGSDFAIPSPEGEHLALTTYAPLEPDPSLVGTQAVYSRTPHGWTSKSIVAPGTEERQFNRSRSGIIRNSDLSLVAFESFTKLNYEEKLNAPHAVEIGPVGGPYALVADIASEFETSISGANAGTAGVPAFADVLFESTDHQLLPPGPERILAEETEPGADDLYEWTDGALRLVNVEGEVKMLNNECGARLGAGEPGVSGASTLGAVSTDGSKVFFTSCGRLYMRADSREVMEISAPAPGVKLDPSERKLVHYNAATPDGSEVIFNTATPLLAGETGSEDKLFMYDTVTHELTLIRSGVPETSGTEGRFVLLSKDGTTVYYNADASIYRYEILTGRTSFIAAINTPHVFNEPSYVTPNGQFLVFVSGKGGVKIAGLHGLEPEPRGVGHNELYRYDAANGSVMCVSCGEGIAPIEGEMLESKGVLESLDESPPFIQMSENGQKVFFQTTAQLVPQDTNSTRAEGSSAGGFPGMDVYEWEADGTEETPGVFCRVLNGCTHLISTGEDVGKATFLGASENGENIFFATAGQLLPQVDGEFPNIYDARVDGGFPPPRGEPECSSCQGVGAPAPLFSPGASGTFVGPANVTAPVPVAATGTQTKTKTKTVKCGKGHVKRKGRCVKTVHGKKVKRASRGARR
jgi:hypothetical protein